MHSITRTKMSDPVKDQIAQEKFGKNFDELDSTWQTSSEGINFVSCILLLIMAAALLRNMHCAQKAGMLENQFIICDACTSKRAE